MLTYILFIIGFVALIKGADMLVAGASSVARRFHISGLVIGLTVVAFGTSTPELFVNLIASFQGNTQIAIGNVVGSNIANVLLILGIAAAIYPLKVQSQTKWKEIPFSLLAAIVLFFVANDVLIDHAHHSEITRSDGFILLGFFSIFMVYVIAVSKQSNEEMGDSDIREMGMTKSMLFILLGLTGLVLGGKWIVDGAINIAKLFNVSESLIGLTVVAVGTSLPELATSAVAAYRKNADIAIGNVVGSNIFNIFFVLGTSAVIKPLPFLQSNNGDLLVTILSSLLLFVFLFIGEKRLLKRWQGIVFLLMYVAYVAWLVIKDGQVMTLTGN